MKKEYTNARDILPPELLAEVQKHATGLMYVPAPNAFFRERRQLILTLREQGVPTREVARLAGLSVRRVNQITAENNKKNADSFDGPPVNNQ